MPVEAKGFLVSVACGGRCTGIEECTPLANKVAVRLSSICRARSTVF